MLRWKQSRLDEWLQSIPFWLCLDPLMRRRLERTWIYPIHRNMTCSLSKIDLITHYAEQAKQYKALFFLSMLREGWQNEETPAFVTVDSSQGREWQHVIFDVVNTDIEGGGTRIFKRQQMHHSRLNSGKGDNLNCRWHDERKACQTCRAKVWDVEDIEKEKNKHHIDCRCKENYQGFL